MKITLMKSSTVSPLDAITSVHHLGDALEQVLALVGLELGRDRGRLARPRG